ncbi:hypothetical protein CDD83_7458 [Cordyceps sp. RAO-2017]|nr:hypothetical protein CDD83_7458 [Cordyceps sp. RAO-2017]
MAPSRQKPTENEWLSLKEEIRKLYLVDNVPLKQLLGKIGERGLVVTKTQLEYQLKKWKFKKNLDKSAWLYVGSRIEKRKREGKESEVIYCGKRLKPSTVDKETDRHRDRSIMARLAPRESKHGHNDGPRC